MIIYNKTWLSNSMLLDLVEREHQQKTISDTELHIIKVKYPVGFYTPNLFIRVGLFIVTVVISLGLERLLNLILRDTGFNPGYGLTVLIGILNYAALLIIVKRKLHYRSGVDDALLWLSFICLVIAFNWSLAIGPSYEDQALSLFIFSLSLFLTLRFSDMLMGVVCYLSLFALVYFSLQKMGPLGIAVMPFILILLSGIAYWLISRSLNHRKALYYAKTMIILQVISLITLYASGNYYLVKELGDRLNNTTSASIPFGWFFWIWTIILPLVFIYRGLIRKDVICLRVGLVLTVAAAVTIRNYYHLTPLELVFIISGGLLLLFSYYLTRYLKKPKHGFTNQQLTGESLIERLQIESLLISEASSGIGDAPANTGTQMGGGKFGGGGAGGNF